jgi:hypothetical protein
MLMNPDVPDATADDLLSRLQQINAVTWRWRDDDAVRARGLTPGGVSSGVIAQDVEAVFPDLVAQDEDGVRRVNYNGLLAVTLEAVKLLDARVQALEAAQRATPPEPTA